MLRSVHVPPDPMRLSMNPRRNLHPTSGSFPMVQPHLAKHHASDSGDDSIDAVRLIVLRDLNYGDWNRGDNCMGGIQ